MATDNLAWILVEYKTSKLVLLCCTVYKKSVEVITFNLLSCIRKHEVQIIILTIKGGADP